MAAAAKGVTKLGIGRNDIFCECHCLGVFFSKQLCCYSSATWSCVKSKASCRQNRTWVRWWSNRSTRSFTKMSGSRLYFHMIGMCLWRHCSCDSFLRWTEALKPVRLIVRRDFWNVLSTFLLDSFIEIVYEIVLVQFGISKWFQL